MSTTELWRAEQLAARLGVSTWRAWLIGRTSLGHARVLVGPRSVRWRPELVEAWIAAGGDAAESRQPAGAA